MKPFWILIAALFLGAAVGSAGAGCEHESPEIIHCQPPLCPHCEPQECNHDGRCDECEDCRWCADCCIACDLNHGAAYEYIVSEMFVPMNATEARTVGVDIDGDGDIDNRAAQIASLIQFDRPYNELVEESIADGRFILLVRLFVDQFPDDVAVTIQLLPGDTDPSHDATEDNLTGHGHALIHPDVDSTSYFCGLLDDAWLESDAGETTFVYPYMDYSTGHPIMIPLHKTFLVSEGAVDENGMIQVLLGGGIDRPTMVNVVLPAIALELSQKIRTDPDSSYWQFARDLIDCGCDALREDCENVVNQQGECACWTGVNDPNPAITASELLCNPLLSTVLGPDVDVDWDGEPDLVSIGVWFSAIPVTIGR